MWIAFALSAVSASTLPADWGPCVAAAIGTVAMLSSVMVSHFECPRCGEMFGKKHSLINDGWALFARRCVHCGLAMGSARWERRATKE